MEISARKKTCGRQKIEIKKIANKQKLQVTFTKRRNGLFRKASEISVLCGAEIAIIVQSPADRIFTYGHPSPDELIDRFQQRLDSPPPPVRPACPSSVRLDVRMGYEDAVRRLEMEKKLASDGTTSGMFWCDEDHDWMDPHELQEYLEMLERVRCTAEDRAAELEKMRSVDSGYPDLMSPQYVNDRDFPDMFGPFDDPLSESSSCFLLP